uniref:Uncharacterized protein n=1 Tax=Glossina austeni TaxID=7395 RepID=A0A1A9VVS3_GLOAU
MNRTFVYLEDIRTEQLFYSGATVSVGFFSCNTPISLAATWNLADYRIQYLVSCWREWKLAGSISSRRFDEILSDCKCRDVANASRGNCCKLVLLRSKRSSESTCHKSGTASNCGLCDRSKVRRLTTCVNEAICCREFARKFNVSKDSGCFLSETSLFTRQRLKFN